MMGRVFVPGDKNPVVSMARLYNDRAGDLDQVSGGGAAGTLQR
jgi:hypothetical protein